MLSKHQNVQHASEITTFFIRREVAGLICLVRSQPFDTVWCNGFLTVNTELGMNDMVLNVMNR